jgi:hypothetical protein
MTKLVTGPALADISRELHLKTGLEERVASFSALEQMEAMAEDASLAEVASRFAEALCAELRSLQCTIASAFAPEPPGAAEGFETWATLELFGHRALIGYVQETVLAGRRFLKLTVPAMSVEQGGDLEPRHFPEEVTFHSPAAVYAMEPCSEQHALVELEKRRDVPF